jgi:hypothetical protein
MPNYNRRTKKDISHPGTTTPFPPADLSSFCPGAMTPYKTGQRISRSTGETIYIFEFKLQPPTPCPTSQKETPMDAIESFITSAIIKALHKSTPTLTADDDAKVTKAVADFVTTTMDLVAVYFAIRNAKK